MSILSGFRTFVLSLLTAAETQTVKFWKEKDGGGRKIVNKKVAAGECLGEASAAHNRGQRCTRSS